MLSAFEAYRQDRVGYADPFTGDDNEWITIGAAVNDAKLCPPAERGALVRAADARARVLFGAAELRQLAQLEWGATAQPLDALILLALAMHDAGAAHLALTIVEGLLGLPMLTSPRQHGRLLAMRAQITHKFGDPELAAERYRHLRVEGTRRHSAELCARADLGLVALAQMRGNYPEMLAAARRAHRYAKKSRLPRLTRRTAYALMVAAAQLGRTDEALLRAWEMYTLARGDWVGEANALAGIGQFLLRLGQPRAAYNALAMVLRRRLAIRVLLPALGGLAQSAAQLGDALRARVTWAAAEVERFSEPQAHPYTLASSLLECSVALREIGDVERAEQLRQRAHRIAEAHHFHEELFTAEGLARMGAPAARLSRQASVVSRRFAGSGPARLPAHVRPASEALVGA